MSSQETLDKARDMLCDVAKLTVDGIPKLQSEFVLLAWAAFNKGREYEAFVNKAEREGK